MGTPEQELESKYFIEGEAHARSGRLERIPGSWNRRARGACNAHSVVRILVSKSVIKSAIRSGRGWSMQRVLPVLCVSFLCFQASSAQEKAKVTTQNAAAASEAREGSRSEEHTSELQSQS